MIALDLSVVALFDLLNPVTALDREAAALFDLHNPLLGLCLLEAELDKLSDSGLIFKLVVAELLGLITLLLGLDILATAFDTPATVVPINGVDCLPEAEMVLDGCRVAGFDLVTWWHGTAECLVVFLSANFGFKRRLSGTTVVTVVFLCPFSVGRATMDLLFLGLIGLNKGLAGPELITTPTVFFASIEANPVGKGPDPADLPPVLSDNLTFPELATARSLVLVVLVPVTVDSVKTGFDDTAVRVGGILIVLAVLLALPAVLIPLL